MKRIIPALKWLATGLFAISTPGCMTAGVTNSLLDNTYNYQGKVLRGEVVQQFTDTSKNGTFGEKFIKNTPFDDKYVVNTRQTTIGFMDGRRQHRTLAFVPDQIEFEDIEKGAIVDFILQYGPRENYATSQETRVLKLVCRAKDEACIRVEKTRGTFAKVVDADPGDASAKYGVTYKRRNTQEDIAKYK